MVAQTIQEYCHGKLIDDHNQFQRIEAHGDHTLSLLNKHDSRLDTLECQIKVLQKHNDTDRSKSTTIAGKPKQLKDKSKVTILVWLNQMKKFLAARQILALEWVTIASTYLETNVAQQWDILALVLESENKDPQLWDNFYDAFLIAYGNINQELVAKNKLRTLRQK